EDDLGATAVFFQHGPVLQPILQFLSCYNPHLVPLASRKRLADGRFQAAIQLESLPAVAEVCPAVLGTVCYQHPRVPDFLLYSANAWVHPEIFCRWACQS